MSASAVPRLLAITPGDGRDLVPWLIALANERWPGVLIREPEASADDVVRLTTFAAGRFEFVAVHVRCTGWEAAVRRNPAIQLHLPASPTAVPDAALRWGASCHDRSGLHRRFDAGAAYALLSPVHVPTSKPADTRPPIGVPEFLRITRPLAPAQPVLALGGMTPEHHRRLCEGGGYGSAILGDLFGQPSPEAAAARARQYLR